MQEGARRIQCMDAAADERLRDERRQVEVGKRGRDFNRRWVDPEGHLISILCQVSDVKLPGARNAKTCCAFAFWAVHFRVVEILP
jgi:hypothetical protein